MLSGYSISFVVDFFPFLHDPPPHFLPPKVPPTLQFFFYLSYLTVAEFTLLLDALALEVGIEAEDDVG